MGKLLSLYRNFRDNADTTSDYKYAINDKNNLLYKEYWDEARKTRPDLEEVFIPNEQATIRYMCYFSD